MRGMDRLLELQAVDSSLDRLRARRTALETGETLAQPRAAADEAERTLGEQRLRLDEMARDQLRFENEIDSLERKEAAERTRMFDGSIVNQKELEALQHELDGLQKRRSDREDELLALMEQREELEREADRSDATSARLREELDRAVDAAEEELATTKTELERLAGERDTLVPLVDPELFERYEDLREAKRGIGAAAIVDGVCQACHEQISAVELDRLKHADGIRRCPNCRRIVVL